MKDYPTFVTAPVHDGRPDLSPAQRKLIADAFRKREGQDVRITISQRTKERSYKQNNLLWKIYGYISDVSGDTSEDIHEACKQEFLGRRFISIGGKEVEIAKSTKTLTTAEFTKYLDRVIQLAVGFYGITLPYEE